LIVPKAHQTFQLIESTLVFVVLIILIL